MLPCQPSWPSLRLAALPRITSFGSPLLSRGGFIRGWNYPGGLFPDGTMDSTWHKSHRSTGWYTAIYHGPP